MGKMGKKILLVNPWIYDFAAYNFWIKPLGLYYLAAYLEKNGHDIEIIDCLDAFADSPFFTQVFANPFRLPRVKEYGDGKFFGEEINKPNALQGIAKKYKRYGMPISLFRKRLEALANIDFILLTSMMTYWYPGLWEAIAILKKHFPMATIVLGGNYATLSPEHAKEAGADFIFTGAIEDAFEKLNESILGAKSGYLPNKKLPDTLPFPAFAKAKRKDFLPILTARGCPFRCSYCASHILNPSFYRRSPDNVFGEINHWHGGYGTSDFAFYDDALLFKPEELFIPLARTLIKAGMSVRFHCPNGMHVAEITANIAELLKDANFRTIRLGLESSDEKSQITTGGKVNNEQFVAAMRYLREAGYGQNDIGVYILCGLPQQIASEVEATIRFVLENGGKPMLAEYSPIPGTKLWQDALAASPYPLAGEPLYHNNSLLPCGGSTFPLADLQKLKALTRISAEVSDC